jgi:DNA-directed RNA polymerase subunit RPC12/RpoP
MPWRCKACETRFYARGKPLRENFYATCSQCGSRELQGVSPDRITGPGAALARKLGLHPLRCEPCRHNFYSIRPPLTVEAMEIATEDSGAKP